MDEPLIGQRKFTWAKPCIFSRSNGHVGLI